MRPVPKPVGPLVAAAAALACVLPLPAGAQALASGEVSLAVQQGVAGTPLAAGFHFTWYRPPVPFLAVRGGVNIGLAHLDTTNVAPFVDLGEYRAFAIDGDVVLAPDHSRLVDAPLGVMDPMLFAGIGVRNVINAQGEPRTLTAASYGGGVSYWLHDIFRVDLEARRWIAVAGPANLAGGFHHDGWSASLGLAFHVASRYTGGPGEPAPPEARVDTVWLEPDTTAGGASAAGGETASASEAAPGADPAPWRALDVAGTRRTVLEEASTYLGTPYVWGGAEPEPGFDCSGFVQHVFEAQGIRLPRPSRIMAQAGAPLPTDVDSLQPGDVLFFSRTGDPDNITHVGIYAGGHTMLHATGSGGGVTYDDLRSPRGRWFADRLVSAARVIDVPIRATRSRIPITPETWDPAWDGAPPKEGVQPPDDPGRHPGRGHEGPGTTD